MLRYTQNQRKKEMKTVEFRRKREKEMKRKKYNNQTVTWWIKQLSQERKLTIDYGAFMSYVSMKIEYLRSIRDTVSGEGFWEQRRWRKNRWWSWCNKRRSEARFLKKFKRMYGGPSQVCVCIGNWSTGGHYTNGTEPTKSIGFRKMFREAGYHVYVIDEYKTSCRCSVCQSDTAETKTFRRVPNPRPQPPADAPAAVRAAWKPTIKCHGLTRCSTCHRLWNRDVNGARNIFLIAKRLIIDHLDRPDYLKRKQRQAAGVIDADDVDEADDPEDDDNINQ